MYSAGEKICIVIECLRGQDSIADLCRREKQPPGYRPVYLQSVPTKKVARQLNEWPMKTLNYETPADKFNVCVAATL